MLYTERGACRLHWDHARGWIIDVPTAVTSQQLVRIAQWALPRQIERWRSLPPGARKDELEGAIALLRQGRIAQRLIDHDGDGVSIPFAATEPTTTRRYVHG